MAREIGRTLARCHTNPGSAASTRKTKTVPNPIHGDRQCGLFRHFLLVLVRLGQIGPKYGMNAGVIVQLAKPKWKITQARRCKTRHGVPFQRIALTCHNDHWQTKHAPLPNPIHQLARITRPRLPGLRSKFNLQRKAGKIDIRT